MIFINHRINTISQLANVPCNNGVELDIRYHCNDFILEHNPLRHHEQHPEKLEDYLKAWHNTGPVILNTKTEGIEIELIDLMKKHNIRSYIFLDLSMPYFVLFARKAAGGEIAGFTPDNLMVRFSEYEPLEYALRFKGMAGWVWVDCFSKLPLDKHSYNQLKKAGFKICVVSPELQKHSLRLIAEFKRQLSKYPADAVCTKRPDLWGEELPPETIKQLEEDYPYV